MLDFSLIFTFLSRELNAVPICPVDKEVIKPQEVSHWFGLGVGESANILS